MADSGGITRCQDASSHPFISISHGEEFLPCRVCCAGLPPARSPVCGTKKAFRPVFFIASCYLISGFGFSLHWIIDSASLHKPQVFSINQNRRRSLTNPKNLEPATAGARHFFFGNRFISVSVLLSGPGGVCVFSTMGGEILALPTRAFISTGLCVGGLRTALNA